VCYITISMAEHRSSRSLRCTRYCFDDVEHLETQGQEPGQEQGQESCSGQPPTFLVTVASGKCASAEGKSGTGIPGQGRFGKFGTGAPRVKKIRYAYARLRVERWEVQIQTYHEVDTTSTTKAIVLDNISSTLSAHPDSGLGNRKLTLPRISRQKRGQVLQARSLSLL
jgi:hypothetical protein